MATEEQSKAAMEKETQIPEWEHIAARQEGAGTKEPGRPFNDVLRSKFNGVLPPHRKYLGMKRRTFLLVLLAVVLALLALIIGLAVGLTRGGGSKNLPLPSNTNTFSGDLTYYGPGLGACGEVSTKDDSIVSLSHLLFDAAGSSSSTGGNSNNNPLCGRMLRAQRYNEAVGQMRSVDLKVVDRCTGCAVDDLDTTESAFEKLAPIADGRVDVTWAWL
ncbi:hypothetical protein PRZ48_009714 [Zasmidium cellare]|uniref:RlpA-like protein double-psi beta-barrel domain-containing protein n=1 Tax=Zasmidium cellare TaxID=395010 RepID=A0ABR0ECG9_ZASCE|nr:hypothetical protein PRZ48_009714 [Zasmidium cellare]